MCGPRTGLKTAILSARSAGAVTARARDLKVNAIYQDAYPKTAAYQKLLQDFKLTDAQVCFMGDDLPDIGVLKRVGLAVSVPNARKEAKNRSDYITVNEGGKGAVREIAEMILKANNKWDSIVEKFAQ